MSAVRIERIKVESSSSWRGRRTSATAIIAFALGFIFIAGILVFMVGSACAGLPLETEGARLPPAGSITLSGAFEVQTSTEGAEQALPLALEYSATDRLELMLEPVVYTAILPKKGHRTTGLGDLEMTAIYRLWNAQARKPALAAGLEVKVPTARDRLIGTGKADYTGYLIVSQNLGRIIAHANLGYTLIGQVGAVHLTNLLSYAAAAELPVSPRWALVSEVYGNTSSLPEAADVPTSQGENLVIPEASGGELVGAIGCRLRVTPAASLSLGISYDNNNALYLAPGLTLHLP